MPTQTDFQYRNTKLRYTVARTTDDETIIADVRARLTPGHFVEQKLRLALSNDGPRPAKPR